MDKGGGDITRERERTNEREMGRVAGRERDSVTQTRRERDRERAIARTRPDSKRERETAEIMLIVLSKLLCGVGRLYESPGRKPG